MVFHTGTLLPQMAKAKLCPSGDTCHVPLEAGFGNSRMVCPLRTFHICTSLAFAVKICLLSNDCHAPLEAGFAKSRIVCPEVASHICTSLPLAVKIRLLSGNHSRKDTPAAGPWDVANPRPLEGTPTPRVRPASASAS